MDAVQHCTIQALIMYVDLQNCLGHALVSNFTTFRWKIPFLPRYRFPTFLTKFPVFLTFTNVHNLFYGQIDIVVAREAVRSTSYLYGLK